MNYEFQSNTILRNKIIIFYNNIPAYNVAILQQTTIIVELINNIYVIIENNKEIMKTKKFELFDSETYFIDRKYYINKSLNLIYNKSFASSSSFNNDFQKKNALFMTRQIVNQRNISIKNVKNLETSSLSDSPTSLISDTNYLFKNTKIKRKIMSMILRP